MFNRTAGKQIIERIDRITSLPQDVLLRGAVIYLTLIFLIVPDFVSVYLLMDDIFVSQRLNTLGSALFEGVVLGMVFLFAMSIIYAMSAGYRTLQYVVVGVAFALVLFSGTFLGQVSNKCIPDGCDSKLYYLSLGVISLITFTAYILPAVINFRVPAFGVVFVAVAVWQSEVWLLISMERVGIDPSGDNIRGLLLLVFALFWVGLFATMQRPKRERQEL
jgi:hypothetical protein